MDTTSERDFAFIVHELRSPLSILKGYTQLMLYQERTLTPEALHEFLTEMHNACNQLDETITHYFGTTSSN